MWLQDGTGEAGRGVVVNRVNVEEGVIVTGGVLQ